MEVVTTHERTYILYHMLYHMLSNGEKGAKFQCTDFEGHQILSMSILRNGKFSVGWNFKINPLGAN